MRASYGKSERAGIAPLIFLTFGCGQAYENHTNFKRHPSSSIGSDLLCELEK